MKKAFLLSVCLIPFLADLNGQKYGVLPMHDLYRDFYNPAFTAYSASARVYAIGSYQNQLYGFGPNLTLSKHGADQFYILGTAWPLIIKNSQVLAMGFNYYKQMYFLNDIDDIRMNIAYQYTIDKHKFMLGGNLDMIRNYCDLRPYLPARNLKTTETDITYNGGLGIAYLHTRSNFFTGIAINHLLSRKLLYKEIPNAYYYIYQPRFNILSGIDIRLNKRWVIKPSVNFLFRPQIDIDFIPDITATYKDHFQFGLFYHEVPVSIGFRLGYKCRNLGLHYTNNPGAFYNLSSLATHTIGLTFTPARKNNFKAYTFNRLLPIGNL